MLVLLGSPPQLPPSAGHAGPMFHVEAKWGHSQADVTRKTVFLSGWGLAVARKSEAPFTMVGVGVKRGLDSLGTSFQQQGASCSCVTHQPGHLYATVCHPLEATWDVRRTAGAYGDLGAALNWNEALPPAEPKQVTILGSRAVLARAWTQATGL